MSSIETVINYSKKIESLLESTLKAEGRGLHEKASSIEDLISPDVIRKIRRIATIRNKTVHEDGYELADLSQFIKDSESVIDYIYSLNNNDLHIRTEIRSRIQQNESSVVGLRKLFFLVVVTLFFIYQDTYSIDDILKHWQSPEVETKTNPPQIKLLSEAPSAENKTKPNVQHSKSAESIRKIQKSNTVDAKKKSAIPKKEESEETKHMRLMYTKLIVRHVGKKWIKPASTTTDMFCDVVIAQNRAGTVLTVQTKKCQGDRAFQQSVERAVRRASPLPDPPSDDVFDRNVVFTFSAGVMQSLKTYY